MSVIWPADIALGSTPCRRHTVQATVSTQKTAPTSPIYFSVWFGRTIETEAVPAPAVEVAAHCLDESTVAALNT